MIEENSAEQSPATGMDKEQRRVKNRLSDVFFKYVFANKNNTDLLIDLLNSCFAAYPLGNRIVIESLSLEDREQDAMEYDDKTSFFDIYATTADGKDLDIEVQTVNKTGFLSRIFYYLTRMHARKLTRGEGYTDLKPSIIVCFTDFELKLPAGTEHRLYLRRYQMTELTERDVLTPNGDIFIIEVPKWIREQSQIPENKHRRIYRWMSYLSNNDPDYIREIAQKDKHMQKLLEIEDRFTQDNARWHAYLVREKAANDRIAELQFAALSRALSRKERQK